MAMEDTGLARPTAAAVEFSLHGEALLLYPLRNMDWGRIEQWMRSQIINATKSAVIDEGLTESQKQTILSSAHKEAAKVSLASCFSRNEVYAFLATLEGMMRIVHLSLRDGPGRNGRPKYELNELDEKLNLDFVALTEMYSTVFELSFPVKAEGQAKNSQAAAPESKK